MRRVNKTMLRVSAFFALCASIAASVQFGPITAIALLALMAVPLLPCAQTVSLGAAYNKFNQFVEDVSKGVHNLLTGALTIALTAAANAPVATNSVLANLTQISYTNLSARLITTTSCVQTSGTLKLILADLVLTASGAVATFRYVVIYNDTPTSPAKPLISWYDYGSDVTLATGETFTIDFDGTNGFLQLA
jgi:hypothetical protein